MSVALKPEIKSKSLADVLISAMDEVELKLYDWTPIQDMPDHALWDSLKTLYSSKKFRDRVVACLINGSTTSRKAKFLLSKRTLQEYLKNDPNISRNYLNGIENKDVMDYLLAVPQRTKDPIVKCIEVYKKDGRGVGKNTAGTFILSHTEILLAIADFDPDHPSVSTLPTSLPSVLPTNPTPSIDQSGTDCDQYSVGSNISYKQAVSDDQPSTIEVQQPKTLFDQAYDLYSTFKRTGSFPNDFFKIMAIGESDFKKLDGTKQIPLFQRFIQETSNEMVDF